VGWVIFIITGDMVPAKKGGGREKEHTLQDLQDLHSYLKTSWQEVGERKGGREEKKKKFTKYRASST